MKPRVRLLPWKINFLLIISPTLHRKRSLLVWARLDEGAPMPTCLPEHLLASGSRSHLFRHLRQNSVSFFALSFHVTPMKLRSEISREGKYDI